MTNHSDRSDKRTQPNIPTTHFRGMIESTPGIPWVVDLSTFQFTYVGPQAEKILGYPVSDWYETDFWPKHMHPDDRDFALSFCAQASEKKEDYQFEYRMLHRDGREVFLLDYVNIIFENEVAVGLQGFMFDVSSDRINENIIKNIAAGTSMKTGQDFYDLLVKHIATLFNADYAYIGLIDINNPNLIHSKALWAHGKLAENISFELQDTPCANVVTTDTCFHASGARKTFPLDQLLIDMNADSYIGTRLLDANNNPIGVIAVFDSSPMIENNRNIEILEIFAARASAEIKRVKAEDALRRHQNDLEKLIEKRTNELITLNTELESFSYSVSHDLRAPLRHIDGFSRIITEDHAESLNVDVLDYLERIRTSANKMGHLIDDLLELSRVSQCEMKRQRVNISNIASEIFEEKAAQLSDRIVTFDIQPDLTSNADFRLVYMVLENLISNALKYSAKKESANIQIGITDAVDDSQKTRRAFFIKDNGAGFDIAYKNKLFTAFQRLHTHTDFEGTGIGLATVQRIINRHGGTIWADAKINEYAVFYFTLGELS